MASLFPSCNRLWRLVICFSFSVCGSFLALQAQTVDATNIGEAVQLESHPWRMAYGDSPEWKRPEFDDSGWSQQTLSRPPFVDFACKPFCWFRLTASVAPSAKSISIGVKNLETSYEVFVNGEKIGGHGGMPPRASSYESNLTLYPVPQSAVATGKLLIAIRLWVSPQRGVQIELSDRRVGSVVLLGRTSDLELWREQNVSRTMAESLADTMNGFLGLFIGLPALILFRVQRNRREYLWLAALGISQAAIVAIDVLTHFDFIPLPWHEFLYWGARTGYLICNIEFAFAFLERPVNRFFRVTECVVVVMSLIEVAFFWRLVPGILALILIPITVLSSNIGITILLLAAWRKGNREAGLLLLATVLGLVLAFGFGSLMASTSTSSSHTGFNPINLVVLATCVRWMTYGVIILRRNSVIIRERSRATAELQAAKTVQDVLMPTLSVPTPGFVLQSAYQPAQEVGGDFFHVLPMDDGALRLVIGDVSGKGLKAAMTVALIVGALDRERSDRPAEVLSNLNRMLVQHSTGGFVTCLCLQVTQEGVATTANAGHFMPFHNGEETAMEANLPLGMTADAEYAEASWSVKQGDRLVLFTDGVPEARKQSSGELFGFERTRKLIASGDSAQQIVSTAQAFGQDDDVTVVELAFAGATV